MSSYLLRELREAKQRTQSHKMLDEWFSNLTLEDKQEIKRGVLEYESRESTK